MPDIKLFAGNATPELAKRISERLYISLGDATVGRFSDGEIQVQINENVRGADVFIVQSTCAPTNDNLMELIVMVDALRRASAGRITAVIPYFGYARQDRRVRSARVPITAKVVADMLSTVGIDRVLTCDLHAEQIQGFFDIPVDHMQALPLMARYFKEKGLYGDDVVVVSPDVGGVKRARKLAEKLDCKIAIIDKRRPKPNVAEVMNLIGEVEGKVAIFIDDMIDTAGTITNGADAIAQRGAKEVYACCSHAVFSDPAIERLEKSALKEVVITDSIALPERKRIDKVKIISVDSVFAAAIDRITNNKSVSELFE